MRWPLRYPLRKPYGAWLFTTLAMLVIGLPGSVWAERLWGISLPVYGVETIVAVSCATGLLVGLIVAYRQKPPEPGDLDDPGW